MASFFELKFDRFSPFALAFVLNQLRTVKLLIQNGVNVNIEGTGKITQGSDGNR